jgi:MarR family transcriptional regulator, organic hydroperoxide resistance regulator
MPAARHPEHDLAYLLSRASHQLTQRLCTILEEEGLTLGQWWVLQLLSDGTRHGMSDAADYAMLPPPSLTKAVDQLVLAKLIDRRADPQDRRRVLIRLTPRGRRRRQQLADRLHPVTTLGDLLDDADVASLRRLLLRLLQSYQ